MIVLKKLQLVLFAILLLTFLSACTSSNENVINEQKVETVIDVTQFSRISSSQLIALLGEPESRSNYEWSIPTTGKSIVGELFVYDQNKYEFILFDDSVVRLNVYSGSFMGYDESKMSFNREEDLFSMFGIKPNSNLKKVADTGSALRYTPVSEKVAEVWIQQIEGSQFDIAKITYNLNYF